MSTTTLMDEFGLNRLSIDQRRQLMEELWKSLLATPEAVKLSPEHLDDLRKRVEDARNDPEVGLPYEEVLARLEEETP